MFMKTALLTAGLIATMGMGCGGDDAPAVGTGPGAKLKCTSSGMNAFDTYGAAAFVAVNEEAVSETLAEVGAHGTTNLGDSFTKVGTGTPPSTADALPAFKGKLAAFLGYAYGGPDSTTYTDGVLYAGKTQDMVAEHTGLNITSAQFDYFIAMIVVPSLLAKNVSMDDVTSCFAPVVTDASFKASIVGH